MDYWPYIASLMQYVADNPDCTQLECSIFWLGEGLSMPEIEYLFGEIADGFEEVGTPREFEDIKATALTSFSIPDDATDIPDP